LNDSYFMQPSEQAVINNDNNIQIRKDINTETELAWKNNLFVFDKTSLDAALRQIARWYDIEVSYEDKVPPKRFVGEISRNTSLQEVLKIFELSGVYFKVDGKKLTVLK